jgi:tRNA1Val (adenine37-N6)-methyltransferase
MPNPYFRFKQFTVRQDNCAMKVCTDSCILGAWTALRLSGANKILDIGTGTGLLSLMLAQKSGAFIDTIESDPESYSQAGENIRQSPWLGRIQLILGDVRKYSFPSAYDFIIINPPFYKSDLRSPVEKKNKARHEESLTMEELISVIRSSVHANSVFSILLPVHRADYFDKLASSSGFFLHEKLIIRQTPRHAPFRTIGLFNRHIPGNTIRSELTIRDEDGKNSPEFSALMNDYYS